MESLCGQLQPHDAARRSEYPSSTHSPFPCLLIQWVNNSTLIQWFNNSKKTFYSMYLDGADVSTMICCCHRMRQRIPVVVISWTFFTRAKLVNNLERAFY